MGESSSDYRPVPPVRVGGKTKRASQRTAASADAAPLNEKASAKTAATGRRSYAGVAPDERRHLRRQRLIEAGVEVFGVRGYHAATVRTVCAQAQLTERYFYESFKSLDDLFTAVYAELSNQLKQATLEALAQTQPKALDLAQSALRVFLCFIRDDPRRARITLIDAVSIGRVGQAAADEAARDYVSMMRSFVMLLYPDVGPRGVNIDVLASGLVGMNIHVATAWAREDFATPLEEVLWTNLLPYRGLALMIETDQLPRLPQPEIKPPSARRRRQS